MRMAMVFHSLTLGSGAVQEALESYINHAYSLVIQRWREITRWMTYLLSCGISAKSDEATLACGQALGMLCNRADGKGYREELLSQDITADVLFILLLQKDPLTDRLWDSEPTPHAAMLSRLLRQSCESAVGRRTIAGRLAAVSKRIRLAVVEAIFLRVHEAVLHFETADIGGVAMTVRCLFDAAKCLASNEEVHRSFEEQGILFRFTQDLCLLSEKASTVHGVSFSAKSFWYDISLALQWVTDIAYMYTPHPSKRIATLIEAGILGCVFRCLAFSALSCDITVDILHVALPYLYAAKAVLARHSVLEPAILSQDTSALSQNALEIWSAWKDILCDCNIFLDWRDKPIRRCNSIMVRDRYPLGRRYI